MKRRARMGAVFVHVSDIHFGQEKGERIHIHADVKQQLILDAKEVISSIAGGRANGILATGDIAHSGTRAEYEEAGIWLDELAKSIGVEIHQVQMIPGNHDLDRSKLSFSGSQILDHIRAGGTDEYEAILNNPTDRAALFARFEDYGRFSFGYNCPLNNEGGFASEMKIELAPGRSIRFIRFNSSLLCHGGEKDECPELMIGARQFTIPRENGVENVVLCHHPLNWYKDREQVREYIRSRARVFISGHEHNPKVSVDNVEEGRDVLMLAAGATAPFKSDDTYTFTYNIIEFDWDEEIDGLCVTIHPRAWNPARTSFESDEKRLGGKHPKFRLQSPSFRNAAELSKSTKSELVFEENVSNSPSLDSSPDNVIENQSNNKEKYLLDSNGYETARLKFFRDLFETERLRILVELEALPSGSNDPITQGLERKFFDMLIRNGKLAIVERLIDKLIEERNGG